KKHDKRNLAEHHTPDLIDIRVFCTVQYIQELIRRQLKKGAKWQSSSDKWRDAEQNERDTDRNVRRMGLRRYQHGDGRGEQARDISAQQEDQVFLSDADIINAVRILNLIRCPKPAHPHYGK